MADPFADLIPQGGSEQGDGTPALATTFGYNDPEDNGVGAWGDVTNRPDVQGVSLPITVLKQQFGDTNKAHGQLVRVTNPETGKSVVAPIVDKGPANWVIARQGNTIDLTHATNMAIGGTGKTPVTYSFVNQNKQEEDPFADLIPQTQGANAPAQPQTQDQTADPFADLIPQQQGQAQAKPSSTPIVPISSITPTIPTTPTGLQTPQEQPEIATETPYDWKGAAIAAGSTAVEQGAGLLAGPSVARAISTAVPIPIVGPALGMAGMVGVQQATEYGIKKLEEFAGYRQQIEEAQQAHPTVSTVTGYATMAPFAIKSLKNIGADFAKTLSKDGATAAAKQLAGKLVGGAIGGSLLGPIRYGLENLEKVTGIRKEEPTPITGREELENGIIGLILSGHAEAEKTNKQLGGPAPEVAPSANPIVNQREETILASADAQAPVPEAPVTPEPIAPAKAATADLNSLIAEQLFHDEGSPEYADIQKQIDAFKQPAEAPVAEAQPEIPNAVQVETTGEVGVRNPPAVGEGMGAENKPEVPATEGQAPKEEVEQEKIPPVHVIPVEGKKVGQVSLEQSDDYFSPIKSVPFSDPEIKQRQYFGDRSIVDKYKKHILEGKPISPIVIRKNGDVYDGYHRATALAELGFEEFPAVFITDEDASGEQFSHYPDWENKPREQKVTQGQVDKAEQIASTTVYDADRAFKKSLNEQGISSKDEEFYNKYKNGINLYKEGKVIFTDNKSLISELKNRGWLEEKQKAKEEVAPKKLENPYQDIVRRYASPDADSFKSTNELVVAVEQLVNKQKNKFLKDAVAKFREGMDIGEEESVLIDRLMEEVEREGRYHEQGIKPSQRGLAKADKSGRKTYFLSDPIISYLNESRIRSKTAQSKYVKSQGGKMGGEYDDAPKLPTSHSSLIYGGEQSIDQAHEALVASGIMSPESTSHDLWVKIDEASKSAIKLEKEESERSKAEKEQEKRNKELEALQKTNPDAVIESLTQDLQGHFDKTRRRTEGGFLELPKPIQEAAIKVGDAVYKAGMTFRDWASEMTLRIGDGVKGFLRQIWNGWKSLGRSGGIGRRPSEDEAALRREQEAAKYAPKPPTEQEAFATKAADAFLKGRGTPITEEELSSILARKFPGISQGQISDLYATASGKPKAAGYAGIFAEPSQQGTMFEQRTTGLKKSVVKQERLSRGLEDIPPQERQSETERVQRAVDRVQADSAVAPSIVARIVDFKEPNISVDDAAALLVERNRLMNDRQNWENILDDEGKSPAERNNAQLQLDSIEEQLNRLDEAQRATGSEWGRLGRMYQRMIAEDYSLESMERKERRNLGRPLEKQEREKLKKEAESIQKTTEELQAAQEKAQTEQEKVAVAETYWKTIQELKAELASSPKIEPQMQRIIERVGSALKSQANKARERVRQRIKEGRFNVGLDPEDIIDHAIIGADYIYEGATDIAKFTTRMVKELGEYVRPYIKEIFAASQQQYDRTTDKVAGRKADVVKEKQKPTQQTSIAQIKATGKAEKTANPFLPTLEHLEDPFTHKLVYELARQHILEGVKGEDNVMKAVHNDIKDVYPDATERDVRRAFSEYGKAKFPSKEADRVALAELRTLTRLQESIDRLTEGLPALKTGLQRNKNTQLIREKQAKLNELLKKVKLPPTEEELASKDAAKQTALRNRIADLDKQLRTGEKLKRTPTEPDSPETENLRLEKNAMEQLLKEIEGEAKPKKTPEEAYNERRQKAIRKKMAEIEERIKNNRYEKAPKRIPPTKSTETQRLELELKRKQNEFDRRQLQYQEENKPRWQKLLQGTSELAKGMAITGYHSLYKILGFDIAKMVTTPIEEFTGSVVSLLPGMKPKEGAVEMGGSLAGRLGKYYGGIPKGAKESLKVYKSGLSESEELFGKVRPNVARWYDFIGGRLHAGMKHIPFTAAEEMYRYNGLSNAEKATPGSTKNDFVKMAIYKTAYEKAQSAKLQEANAIAEGINSYFQRMEQVDPKTGKASLEKLALSTAIKVFLTKGIIKTPANYFKQVYEGGIGLPKGALKYLKATWNGLDNLTAVEQDAIYKAFKVGGIGFAMGLYGYIDSFKDKKNRVFGGYYQSGRKEGDGDAKWGTVRINGHTFHYIAHNPVTELAQFGSTVGRVQQALMKKTDMPTAIATGFGKSIIALLGNAPVSGPLMRLGQPYSDPIGEIARSLVPALVSNIAQDTKGDKKYAPTNPLQQIESNVPGLQKYVPLAKPKRSSSGLGGGFGKGL
jgi:hypothetical protein